MSEQTLDYENVDTYKAGSMIDGTPRPYAKCLLCGFHYSGTSLSMFILFLHENVKAFIICHMQQYVYKVIMYIFTHKAAGSHRSLLIFFRVSTFLAIECICAYSYVFICERQSS